MVFVTETIRICIVLAGKRLIRGSSKMCKMAISHTYSQNTITVSHIIKVIFIIIIGE